MALKVPGRSATVPILGKLAKRCLNASRLIKTAPERICSESWDDKVILLEQLKATGGIANDMYEILNNSHPLDKWDYETDIPKFYLAKLLLLIHGPFGKHMIGERARERGREFVDGCIPLINQAKLQGKPLIITTEDLLEIYRDLVDRALRHYYEDKYELEDYKKKVDLFLGSSQNENEVAEWRLPSIVRLPKSVLEDKVARILSLRIGLVTGSTTWSYIKEFNFDGDRDRAIEILDVIDEVATSTREDKHIQEICMDMIFRMCQASGEVPTSLFIRGITVDVEEQMNGGGCADIYRGLMGETKVALKFPRSSAQLKDLRREAALLKHLNHPNIVEFLGINEKLFDKRLCIVLPWIEGGNIMAYLNSNGTAKPLPLIHQAAKGLAYIHSLKHVLIHGDLKGQNVLVERTSDNTYQALLADFGFSIWEEYSKIYSRKGFVGTPRWMAPELLGEKSGPNKATDIYSFGMTVYEVITGEVPFKSLGEYAIKGEIESGKRPEKPPKTESRPKVFDDVWNLIVECWKQSPKKRLTATDVEKKLSKIINDCSRDNSGTYTREFILGKRTTK